MSKEEYFSIASACRLLSIHKDELYEFAIKGQVVFSVRFNNLAGVLTASGKIGVGVGYLNGYANVSNYTVELLATKHQMIASRLRPASLSDVVIISTEYPFTVSLPNTVLDGWDASISKKYQIADFIFYVGLKESVSTPDLIKAALERLDELHPDNVAKGKEGTELRIKLEQRRSISEGETTIYEHQLHISLSELRKAKQLVENRVLALLPIEQRTTQTETLSETIIKEPKRPIDKLLTRMLIDFPNEKPSSIWRMLQKDIVLKERLYDTDEILDEVGKDELYWFKESGEVESLKQKSFYNLMKNIKSNLNL